MCVVGLQAASPAQRGVSIWGATVIGGGGLLDFWNYRESG